MWPSVGLNLWSLLSSITAYPKSALKKFPSEHDRLVKGETKLVNFFIGYIIKESKGKYLPANITKYLKKEFG